MRLNPKEQEKLMLHMAGNLAKERKERGLKLNYVEALAYISSELLELARDGKTVVELMQLGTKILTKDDVMSLPSVLTTTGSPTSFNPANWNEKSERAGYPSIVNPVPETSVIARVEVSSLVTSLWMCE